jgi:hypothetical protein
MNVVNVVSEQQRATCQRKLKLKKNFGKVLENLVLMDGSVDGDDVTLGKTRKRLKQIMRQKQEQYEFRTNERKKTMFYHPLNVSTGSALKLVYIALLILRQRSNDIVLESFAFYCLRYSCSFQSMLFFERMQNN